MKMLENQRNKKENISDQQSQFPTVNNESKVEQETSSTSGINKPSLMKKVLLRNANKPISSEDKDNNTSSESSSLLAPSKTNKANVLRSYESLYVKIG